MAMWRHLKWAFIGALIGNLSAAPTNKVVDRAFEMWCPSERFLDEGLALRKQAEEQGAADKHKGANDRIKHSAACGNPEAIAQLGMAYCHGWGVIPDRGHGLAMIRRAYARGAPLTPDWFFDPDVCPAKP